MTDYADTIYGAADYDKSATAKSASRAELKAAAAAAHEAYDSAKGAAAAVLEDARDRAKALASDVTDKVQSRYGDVEAWVQLKPAQALGAAAGIGVLLGLLLAGRSRRVVYRDRQG
jgi:ElaB/YqjD/DUF883 family membrane-anchored ribosome-binding protein